MRNIIAKYQEVPMTVSRCAFLHLLVLLSKSLLRTWIAGYKMTGRNSCPIRPAMLTNFQVNTLWLGSVQKVWQCVIAPIVLEAILHLEPSKRQCKNANLS